MVLYIVMMILNNINPIGLQIPNDSSNDFNIDLIRQQLKDLQMLTRK